MSVQAASVLSLIQYVRDNGGFVHPDLQLLAGDEAEHGQVSLAGVPNDTLSLRVPQSLAERMHSRGPWLDFCESMGATIDAKYIATREFRKGVIPIASAANHNSGKFAGSVVDGKEFLELYGVDFPYGGKNCKKSTLFKIFGITGE
ncbi:MAG: hypothetical protein ACPGSM_20770 [Thiolinea sp.]